MSTLRATLRFAALIAHACFGLVCVTGAFPILDGPGRDRMTHAWSRTLMRIVGVRWSVRGVPPEGLRGALLASNHVSWLDIYAINALSPVHFVAKSEIRGWPVIGLLAARTGTIFLERGRRRAVHDVLHRMAAELRAGQPCVVFPEGTTSEGRDVLPFHANLLQAAIESGAPVHPVALRYTQDGAFTAVPAYVGDETLFTSMRRVLGARGIAVHVEVMPALDPAAFPTRHALAEAVRDAVVQGMRA